MASEQSTLVTNLRKVITLIDRLRDVGLNKYISMPRIAVLGSQSSGKSSLLEQIVGLDFLPRGEGTVTRRPLELRLVYVPKEKLNQPYGVFEEIQGQKFSDFAQIKANIDRLTDSIAGNKKGIVDKPIVLTIFSPTCPDLTIIDLPGITKIPIKGSEQTVDVEKVTKDMAARYCRDPKTIILCVIPANADITTSDGLMMARQLDPTGSRTIGVITKIDLMDRGTDAKRLLHGEDVSLKLGYVGVKNRSQADINEKKTVLQALEDERKFFSTSAIYSSLPAGLVGTRSLTNKLTDVLYQHIRTCLPEIIAEIQKSISEKENRLKELGPSLPDEDNDRMKYIWKIINEFTTAFKNSINGSYDRLSVVDKGRLPAGHRIRLVLKDLYSDICASKPTDMYSDIDIKNAMIKHEGDSIPGFPSIDAFLYLLTPLLERLKEPAFECVNEIYHVLEEIATSILAKIINKAPALKDELQESILDHFKTERESCREKIEGLIDSEIGYIFTNDVEYLVGRNNGNNSNNNNDPKQKQPPAPQGGNSPFGQRTSGDPVVHELRNRLDDYFTLVMRGIRDSIPKFIGFFLVKASQGKLQQTLFDATRNSEKYFNLMAEPAHLQEERKAIVAAVETFKASIKMIRRDPDFSPFFNQADKLLKKDPPVDSKQPPQGGSSVAPPPPFKPNPQTSSGEIKPNQPGMTNPVAGGNPNMGNQGGQRPNIFPPNGNMKPMGSNPNGGTGPVIIPGQPNTGNIPPNQMPGQPQGGVNPNGVRPNPVVVGPQSGQANTGGQAKPAGNPLFGNRFNGTSNNNNNNGTMNNNNNPAASIPNKPMTKPN